jgi:hypothetical protein
VGTEIITLAFTASVVALSVWTLKRWEGREQDPQVANPKKSEESKDSGTQIREGEKVQLEPGTRKRARQFDVESQTAQELQDTQDPQRPGIAM